MQLTWFTTLTNIYNVKVNIYFHILFLEVFISNDSYHFVFQRMILLKSLAGWVCDETIGPKHCEFGCREFKVYFFSVSRLISRREQTTHIYINPGRIPGIGYCPIDQYSVSITCNIWRQLSHLKQSSLVQQIFLEFLSLYLLILSQWTWKWFAQNFLRPILVEKVLAKR